MDADNVDELDDDFQSEPEDDDVFKIRGVLLPPAANSYTTKQLHG